MSQKFEIDQPITITKNGSADGSSQKQQQPANKNLLAGQFIDGYPLRRMSKKKLLLNFFDLGWIKPDLQDGTKFSALPYPFQSQPSWIDIGFSNRGPTPPTQAQYDQLQALILGRDKEIWRAGSLNMSQLLETFHDDWINDAYFPIDLMVWDSNYFVKRIRDYIVPSEDKQWTAKGLEIRESDAASRFVIRPRLFDHETDQFYWTVNGEFDLAGVCTMTPNKNAERVPFKVDQSCDIYLVPQFVFYQAYASQSHNTVFSPPPNDAFYKYARSAYPTNPADRKHLYDRNFVAFKQQMNSKSFDYNDFSVSVAAVQKRFDALIAIYPQLSAQRVDGTIVGSYPNTTYSNAASVGSISLINAIPKPQAADTNYYTFSFYELNSVNFDPAVNWLVAIVKKR